MRALVTLRGRMIDLEHFHTGQLGHAPCAAVVTGAEDDELCRATGDRVADRRVDGRGAKGDHVSHDARHFERHAPLSFSGGLLGLGETPLAFLVQKDARGRVVEIRDVRQAGIGEGAAVGDEVGSPAGPLSFHGSAC